MTNQNNVNNTTRELTLMALFIAMTTIATMIIRVPTITSGYVNIGDAMIFFVALSFGKKYGAICGGIGSALADLISGYTHYILITLVVKGLEGFVVGCLFKLGKKKAFVAPLACLVGGAIMVLGYFACEATFLSYGMGALKSVVPNIVQAGTSLVLAQAMYFTYDKLLKK